MIGSKATVAKFLGKLPVAVLAVSDKPVAEFLPEFLVLGPSEFWPRHPAD